MTEDDLQQHVVHLMRSHGRPDVCWFAVPNGEQRKQSIGAKLKRAGVTAGAPDMVFLVDGKFHGVELKTLAGRATESQRNFGKWIEVAGGAYHICHGIDQTFKCLQRIGCLLPGIRISSTTSPEAALSRATKSI